MSKNAPKIPRPPRCNPFKEGSPLADQFTSTLRLHAAGHKDYRRGAGNGLASAFWHGYDGILPSYLVRGSWAWAAFRAGQYVRATTK